MGVPGKSPYTCSSTSPGLRPKALHVVWLSVRKWDSDRDSAPAQRWPSPTFALEHKHTHWVSSLNTNPSTQQTHRGSSSFSNQTGSVSWVQPLLSALSHPSPPPGRSMWHEKALGLTKEPTTNVPWTGIPLLTILQISPASRVPILQLLTTNPSTSCSQQWKGFSLVAQDAVFSFSIQVTKISTY